MNADSQPMGSGCPLLSFTREPVLYRNLLVSRFVALTFEKELGSDNAIVLALGCVPTFTHEEGLDEAIPDAEALALLKERYMGVGVDGGPFLEHLQGVLPNID